MTDGHDGILLTDRDVQGWRDRKAELDKEIADAQKELAEIDRKLEAAAALLDRDGPAGLHSDAGAPPADELEEDDGFGSPVAG